MISTKFAGILFTALFAAFTVLAQHASESPSSLEKLGPEFTEIHIDQDCRVLTPGRPTTAHATPQARYRYNSIVCHIESHLHSSHCERETINRSTKRAYVFVNEREYILQNTNDKPVAFVVSQPLLKGWHIDSDPQPTDIQGHTATFRVVAEPGQIVRLHIGERT